MHIAIYWPLYAGLFVGVLFIFEFVWAYNFFYVAPTQNTERILTPVITQALEDDSAIASPSEWEREKDHIRSLFEEHIYGPFPRTDFTWKSERRVLDENGYHGKGLVEEIILSDPSDTVRIPIVLVTPKNKERAPLIVASNFCANHHVFSEYPVEKPVHVSSICDIPYAMMVKELLLGTYIQRAPVEEALDRGYAFAGFYTGSVAPDSKELAPEALEVLSTLTEKPVEGVIAAWAWGYTQIVSELKKDPRINDTKVAIYGHSRDGKASLLAGAFGETINLVIAHQSGRGGVAPTQSLVGESVVSITRSFPHWFAPQYASFNTEGKIIDQHFLVGLLAPRPALFTGGYLDKWADPQGAFISVKNAVPVYDLYKTGSFGATRVRDFRPQDTLAFFMRPLNHGVRVSDWRAIFTFLDAHF